MSGHRSFGLTAGARQVLANRLLRRTPGQSDGPTSAALRTAPPLGDPAAMERLATVRRAGALLGIADPYFRAHDGVIAETTRIGGEAYDNFTSYNYLGLNGHPRVNAAAKAAIDQYGTSVSASRVVSGERVLHRELEAALARLYQAEDCLTLVSGHATNVTVIGHLVGSQDAVVYDELSHNSIVQGSLLSGARRLPFRHNDLGELNRVLGTVRGEVARVLVVVEGHYSMDGDVPDLAGLLALVRRWDASLMVDEAHSLGVLGRRGHGIAEHCGVDPAEVDLWMGTLSKTLSGCGGYVAGRKPLIDYLRFTAPGFVYSVGMPPPVAAAALASLAIMAEEPARVERLQRNALRFRAGLQAHGLQTGTSIGASIVPVMVGSSVQAAKAADLLFGRGINVQPIIHPAVPERSARLRFFITSRHDESRLDWVAGETAAALTAASAAAISSIALAARLRLE